MKVDYPVSFQTVDIACIKGTKILLGTKTKDKGKWRLPGGFVDVTDESLEAAARREFKEECGASLVKLKYFKSFRVDDPRYRESEHKILTALFKAKTNEPVKAGDDLSEVSWFNFERVKQILEKDIVEEHIPLIKLLL